jgi:hydrogenase maturation factor
MNLLFAEIAEIFSENGMRFGRVRVGGALKSVPLELIIDAAPGDRVLLCDGVAISKMEGDPDVPRDTW